METILLVFIIIILCAIIYIIYTNFKTTDKLHNIQQHLTSLSHVINNLSTNQTCENPNLKKEMLNKFEENMKNMFKNMPCEGEYVDDDFNGLDNSLPVNMNMLNNAFIISSGGNTLSEQHNAHSNITELTNDDMEPVKAEQVEDINLTEEDCDEMCAGECSDECSEECKIKCGKVSGEVAENMGDMEDMEDMKDIEDVSKMDDGELSVSGFTDDDNEVEDAADDNIHNPDETAAAINVIDILNAEFKKQFEDDDDFNFTSDEDEENEENKDNEDDKHFSELDNETKDIDDLVDDSTQGNMQDQTESHKVVIETENSLNIDDMEHTDSNTNDTEDNNTNTNATNEKMNYELLNLKELKQIAKNLNLSTKGGKPELIEKIKAKSQVNL